MTNFEQSGFNKNREWAVLQWGYSSRQLEALFYIWHDIETYLWWAVVNRWVTQTICIEWMDRAYEWRVHSPILYLYWYHQLTWINLKPTLGTTHTRAIYLIFCIDRKLKIASLTRIFLSIFYSKLYFCRRLSICRKLKEKIVHWTSSQGFEH